MSAIANNQLILALMDALPHPAMLINRNREVVVANKIACDLGAVVGDFCWKEFGKCAFLTDDVRDLAESDPEADGIHCYFCRADDCLAGHCSENDPAIEAFDRILDTYWVAVADDLYLHYAIDITDHVRLEDSYSTSEERLMAAMEANSNGLWEWNLEGEKFFFKVADSAIIGFPPDVSTISYEAFLKHVHPEDEMRIRKAFDDHLIGVTPNVSVEFRIVNENGYVNWILSRGRIVRYGVEGEPLRMIGTHTDITEQKITESKLSWELHINIELAKLANSLISPGLKIREIAELVLQSALSLTRSCHGYVSEIDPETRENVCHTLTAMLGNACRMERDGKRIAFPAKEDGTYGMLWGHSLNTRNAFFTNSPVAHPKSGGLPKGHIPIERFLSVPVLYKDDIIGQIALANSEIDYTHDHLDAIKRLADLFALALIRKRAEQELIQMQSKAIRTSQLATLGEISAGVAHEINNPISGVINYAQMILNKADKDSMEADLSRRIIKEGDRIAGIVSKLLSFSHHDEGLHQLHDVRALIDIPVSLVSQALQHEGITIDVSISKKVTAIYCNAQHVEQVLLNLISNAQYALNKKYPIASKEKRININVTPLTKDSEKFVAVEVKDFGTGIAEDVLPKMFNTFFTTKEAGIGTGLGLSIIEGIMEAHNGSISVESVAGEYSRFILLFPVRSGRQEN